MIRITLGCNGAVRTNALGGTNVTRIEAVQKFVDAQTSRNADVIAELLAEQAVLATPRGGDVSGRAAIVDRIKNPPQGMGGGGGGMMGQIEWSAPVEDANVVKMTATTPMGSITRSFTFDDSDKITRIEFARG